MAKFTERLVHAWNAFLNRNPAPDRSLFDYGVSYSRKPDRTVVSVTNERTIIPSIYTRMSIDIATVDIKHVRVDSDGNYSSVIKSSMNDCFTVAANLDQSALAFKQDIALSIFEAGVIGIAPIDTDLNPTTGSFDIRTMRVGPILEWYPKHVKVRLYNEETGKKEDLVLPKSIVAIVENPFYSVMNEPNSTLMRLVKKLNLLDKADENSGSGKLDLIIQLPYTIRSEARKQQAIARRKDIEMQLTEAKYGIAYTDATEKITQLNRPVENTILKSVEYLTNLLYSQLGLTASVLDGTADEKTMINYYNRTINPIVGAVVEAMICKFLTKTARTQGQSIMYFRDPFKLLPLGDVAEISDKFTRNAILTANEIRAKIGVAPSKDADANRLRNKNMGVDKDVPEHSPEAVKPNQQNDTEEKE